MRKKNFMIKAIGERVTSIKSCVNKQKMLELHRELFYYYQHFLLSTIKL